MTTAISTEIDIMWVGVNWIGDHACIVHVAANESWVAVVAAVATNRAKNRDRAAVAAVGAIIRHVDDPTPESVTLAMNVDKGTMCLL